MFNLIDYLIDFMIFTKKAYTLSLYCLSITVSVENLQSIYFHENSLKILASLICGLHFFTFVEGLYR